jgi:hypothetical protein
MTSEERHEARYQRRKAERAKKRRQKLSQFDNFERVINVDNLYLSFKKAKKGVSWKESVQRYEANALRNILETRRKLLAGESVRKGFVEFIRRERGKVRHIKSIHISERVVQKCLCDQVITPILSGSLIYDNGASMRFKGTRFAFRRLILHLSKYYREYKSNDGYALLIDFSKYFDTVDHEILFKSLDVYIKDERVRKLTRDFISAFGAGISLGLGSQISQTTAVFHPSKIDYLCKNGFGIRYYGRYMDDLYILHNDKDYLKFCLDEIKKVCDKLKITINEDKTRIVKLRHGIKFLQGKYCLLDSGKILCLPCKDSTKRMRQKLKKFYGLLKKNEIGFQDIRNSYQSWRGNYKNRFNAYYHVRFMDKLYNELFISNHTITSGGKP